VIIGGEKSGMLACLYEGDVSIPAGRIRRDRALPPNVRARVAKPEIIFIATGSEASYVWMQGTGDHR
jgi:hypothetical protein